jgi:PPOX class probable F420-dependent enzyme
MRSCCSTHPKVDGRSSVIESLQRVRCPVPRDIAVESAVAESESSIGSRVESASVPFEMTDQISRHLTDDRVAWLTTVSAAGRPIPRPIWFFWDGSHILIYSLNSAVRVPNIRSNERVSVHFNSTVDGEDAVEVAGIAEIVDSSPLPSANERYMKKYGRDIEAATDFDLESVDRDYRTLIRIEPVRAWTVS